MDSITITAKLFDYGQEKILGYFGKAKVASANVKQNGPVIFEDSLDELTSNLYELGFKLSEK
ncbi:hypothetical protein A3305_07315 (plasmid) [Rickettsia amblyommatis]|uniref:hypothetical protein n=1 Tax=Rickettsia amblyommatis TaxID=33989 RepID=UPI0002D9EA96|nr:hypothetical protein [Rickettsia amblyommatis]ARD88179.1 hypothetical protein A3305_07315 [Rickettsia amblyommatis]